ncbi:MAG: alanine racemase [Candidatus Cloacimonetes bacterium]|jgi:alanine racemase|nr:alanine racemase [Candidatus Cloacimonadota bacterium]
MKNDRSWTEINLTNFKDNLDELKKFFHPQANFMQIVKADAYGHGAFQIAKKAIECEAVSLGVANLQEGLLLRYQGIKVPIIILSPSMENEIEQILENNLIPTISTLDFAVKLNKQGKCKIHINIDTGMGRSGFHYKSALENINKIKNLKNLEIDGIFSHFSSAEEDPKFTKLQSDRFKKLITTFNIKPKYIHISNSSGVITFPNKYANLVRLGLLSYGVYSNSQLKSKVNLKPVMTFKSRITQIKSAKKGDSIGYNRTFLATQEMKYAILPFGYADGYDFLLSNKGKVAINNQICNIVGKVSMDMTAVDISKLKKPKVGDEVILLGDANKNISVESLTSLYDGLSYELLSQIGRRAKRYYKENGKIIDSSPLLRREFMPKDFSDNKLGDIIETAIEQRLQSKEIANLVHEDILKRLFAEKDKDIQYRRNFRHSIKFENSTEFPKYFLTSTNLSFTKKLQNDYFSVACAKTEKDLEKYFLRNDVEYRWLLDNSIDLEEMFFTVTSVKINDITLYNEMKIADGCIEIKCYHHDLNELVGKEVDFSISTKTYYPKSSHQLSVFIIEMTQGVNISFESDLKNVEAVPIFSGKSKFPKILKSNNKISIFTDKDEWVFPTSGVVFVY